MFLCVSTDLQSRGKLLFTAKRRHQASLRGCSSFQIELCGQSSKREANRGDHMRRRRFGPASLLRFDSFYGGPGMSAVNGLRDCDAKIGNAKMGGAAPSLQEANGGPSPPLAGGLRRLASAPVIDFDASGGTAEDQDDGNDSTSFTTTTTTVTTGGTCVSVLWGSSLYTARTRSNFLGTHFKIDDPAAPSCQCGSLPLRRHEQPQEYASLCVGSNTASMPSVSGKMALRRASCGSDESGHCTANVPGYGTSPTSSMRWRSGGSVSYELNVAGLAGPRKMRAVLPMHKSLTREVPRRTTSTVAELIDSMSLAAADGPASHCSVCGAHVDETVEDERSWITLKSKSPTWHEDLHCWCLDFNGRVLEASVKNFQLIAENAEEEGDGDDGGDGEGSDGEGSGRRESEVPIIMQFGKMSENLFSCDFRAPLSCRQAFAIALTSLDSKLGCE